MRIAITGGAGFLGLAAAKALADRGHAVLVLDRSATHLPPEFAFRTCDVTEQDDVAAAFIAFRPQAIIHLAAMLTLDSRADIVAATRVNALGTAHVFAAAHACGAERVVYASSVAALGDADVGPGDASVPRPASVYGATKAYAEHLACAFAADQPDMALIGLRFGSVYGPGRARGWRAIQTLVEQAAAGQPQIVYPDFAAPIDWTWIDDAAEVAARAALAPLSGHHVFNVAGDKRMMREAAAHLSKRCPASSFTAQPDTTPPAAWDFANDGLAAAIGYTPQTRMEEGIDRMLAAAGH
jgi:nucleoside-diphosphate-sugar epimerase